MHPTQSCQHNLTELWIGKLTIFDLTTRWGHIPFAVVERCGFVDVVYVSGAEIVTAGSRQPRRGSGWIV